MGLFVINVITMSNKEDWMTRGVKMFGLATMRLESLGNVERLMKGVCRMGGSPSLREEDVLAAWLSIDPGRCPGDLSTEGTLVAMGATAAWLYGLGEIGPAPYEFCTAERKHDNQPTINQADIFGFC